MKPGLPVILLGREGNRAHGQTDGGKLTCAGPNLHTDVSVANVQKSSFLTKIKGKSDHEFYI
jgi:hypothetical protein